MSRRGTIGILVAMVLLLATDATAAGPGQGSGREKTGRRDCGNELVVVLPDGTKRQYVPPAALFAGLATRQIEQGEQPRDAVKLDDLFSALGGTWAEALDCDNRSVHLPAGLPMEGDEFIVLTGRGTLKAVREVQRGHYSNVAQGIRKLTLHQAESKAHEGKAKK